MERTTHTDGKAHIDPIGHKLTYQGKRFGELLIDAGIIDESGLKQALDRQRATGGKLGEVLISLSLATEAQIVEALAQQLAIEVFDISRTFTLDPDVVLSIPEHIARHHHALAVGRSDTALTVAMSDPLDLVAIDDIRIATGSELELQVGLVEDIDEAIGKAYQNATAPLHLEQAIAGATIELEPPEHGEELTEQELRSRAEDAPIVRLVNLILSQAIAERATDIHIEPLKDKVIVRYRVDGTLFDSTTAPVHFHEAIVVRIKILSDMDVAEKRVPLDGRFTVTFEQREIDVRVSTLPTIYGEKVAMRLLDKSGIRIDLEALGFETEMLETFRASVRRPYGMVLISGPTGSGKSTTLYAAMKELDRLATNITTLEDPVEYHLDRINQVSINRKAGMTFATGLRSILRQDPDVILVGEVRDLETAELAVRSSLTGHLVLSTVHANDAPSTATRLVDIGIEPYLVTSAVHLVMAQRLVRKICPHCREPYAPEQSAVKALAGDALTDFTFVRGTGCRQCRGRGYLGRTAIFEVLEMTSEINDMIMSGSSASAIRRKALREGFLTLRENSIAKVRAGITTVEEALGASTELL